MAVRLWHGPADGQRLLSLVDPLLDGIYNISYRSQPEAPGGAAHQVSACREEANVRVSRSQIHMVVRR